MKKEAGGATIGTTVDLSDLLRGFNGEVVVVPVSEFGGQSELLSEKNDTSVDLIRQKPKLK